MMSDVRLLSVESDVMYIQEQLNEIKSILEEHQQFIITLAMNQKKLATNFSTWPYITIQNDKES